MLAPTRHQETVDRIAAWIVGGRFSGNATMPTEEEIGVELGVSRTVVREAMRTLVAKGMVDVRRRHGTQVRPVDTWSLFDPQVLAWRVTGGLSREFVDDLIHFRLGIEPHAAELAARNPAFPAWALEDAFRRMSAAVDGTGDYHAADLDFHEAIIVGSNNQFLRQLVPLIANTLRVSFSLSVLSMETARGSLPMHRAVADAIVDRKPDRARSALKTLIEAARGDILAVLPDTLWEERADGKGNRLPVQGP